MAKSSSAYQLDSAADYYRPSGGPDSAVIQLDKWWVEKYVRGPRVLELGCGEGIGTRDLLDHCESLEVVEGAKRYCEFVQNSLGCERLKVHHSFYEEFKPISKFDDIVFARSLDYVAEPISLLKTISTWLNKEGRLHLVVQNSGSLHRRLGVALGMLPQENHLSEHDVSAGHKRVYDIKTAREHLEAAGFKVTHQEGYFLKPFDFGSLEKISKDLLNQLIPALNDVSRGVEDSLCSQLYFRCETM